jgi:hypothetical protein
MKRLHKYRCIHARLHQSIDSNINMKALNIAAQLSHFVCASLGRCFLSFQSGLWGIKEQLNS